MKKQRYYSINLDDIRPGLIYEKLNGQMWEIHQLNLEDYMIVSGHSAVYEIIQEVFIKKSDKIRIPLLSENDFELLGFEKDIVDKQDGIVFRKGKFKVIFNDLIMNVIIYFNDSIIFNGKLFNSVELNDTMIRCDILPNSIIDSKLKSIRYGGRT